MDFVELLIDKIIAQSIIMLKIDLFDTCLFIPAYKAGRPRHIPVNIL